MSLFVEKEAVSENYSKLLFLWGKSLEQRTETA